MPHDDAVSLFLAYLQDGKDPVNPSLPAVDDPSAYLDPLEMPGDFIEKLAKATSAHLVGDDLDNAVTQTEFANPINFPPGSIGYRKRIVMNRIVEQDGFHWAYGIDDQGRTVASRFLGAVED
jgi:hypothetical protein